MEIIFNNLYFDIWSTLLFCIRSIHKRLLHIHLKKSVHWSLFYIFPWTASAPQLRSFNKFALRWWMAKSGDFYSERVDRASPLIVSVLAEFKSKDLGQLTISETEALLRQWTRRGCWLAALMGFKPKSSSLLTVLTKQWTGVATKRIALLCWQDTRTDAQHKDVDKPTKM